MQCPECGKDIPDRAKLCCFCGAEVTPAVVDEPKKADPDAPARRKPKPLANSEAPAAAAPEFTLSTQSGEEKPAEKKERSTETVAFGRVKKRRTKKVFTHPAKQEQPGSITSAGSFAATTSKSSTSASSHAVGIDPIAKFAASSIPDETVNFAGGPRTNVPAANASDISRFATQAGTKDEEVSFAATKPRESLIPEPAPAPAPRRAPAHEQAINPIGEKQAEKAAEKAAAAAEKQAQLDEKAAAKAAAKAEKLAKKQARLAEKQAKKQARLAAREAKKAQRYAAKHARQMEKYNAKQAAQAEKDAKAAALAAEKEAKAAAQQAQRDRHHAEIAAQKAQRQAEKDQQSAALAAEKAKQEAAAAAEKEKRQAEKDKQSAALAAEKAKQEAAAGRIEHAGMQLLHYVGLLQQSYTVFRRSTHGKIRLYRTYDIRNIR